MTTETPPPAGTTPDVSQTPWFSGFDEETRGYIQNKGLASKTMNDAFLQVSKFHREAERMIGAPANELLRLPKDQNSPEWAGVYKRLGALNAPDEYKFDGVKHTGDKPLNDALVDTLRKAAHSAHMSPDSAAEVAKSVVNYLDGIDANKAAEVATRLANEKKSLKDNWGANEAANMVVARAAAKALGVDENVLDALGNVAGYAKTMDMFRQIGMKIGEGRFVQTDNNGGDKVMTKEQALAEKTALKADAAWVKRYLSGGVEEKRRMEAIDRIISGVAA